MKVYIGPYKNFIGPFQLVDKLFAWVPNRIDEDGISRKPDWIDKVAEYLAFGSNRFKNDNPKVWFLGLEEHRTWFHRLLLWIDSKRGERRISVRIDPHDTWNMNGTLALIILPMLKQLRNTKQGSPGDMRAFEYTSNSAQGCFDFYVEGDDDAWEAGHKEWMEILDKMIYSFTEIQRDWTGDHHTGESSIMFVKDDESGNYIMQKGPNDTAHFDLEGYKKHAERIQEGFELFGKYYQSLWD